MTHVLMNGIPEAVFVSPNVLRPILAVFSAIYHAFVKLRLYNEYLIDGHNNVVNLRAVTVV